MLSFVAATSSPDEVTWQVAFWALIPLALGTMSQPVGRMFDIPSKYGFWLRSTPIFCVGDLIYFMLRVIFTCSLQGGPFLQRVKEEIRYRYRDEDWSKESKDVEKSALRRWIVILIGSIPCQTIKVMFMGDIPFTQTLAMMFIIPMVFGEILIIAAKVVCRKQETMKTHQKPTLPNPKLEGFKRVLYGVQAGIFLAVPIKIILFEICPHDELAKFDKDIRDLRSKWSALETNYTMGIITGTMLFRFISDPLYLDPRTLTASGLRGLFDSLYYAIFIEPVLVTFGTVPNIFSTYASMFAILICMTEFVMVMFIWVVYNGFASKDDPLASAVWNLFLYACSLVAMVLTVFILRRIENALLKVLSLLGWMSKTKLWRMCGIPTDPDEQSFLIMFLINLAITISGYAYLFDGKGTSIPSWIGVFG